MHRGAAIQAAAAAEQRAQEWVRKGTEQGQEVAGGEHGEIRGSLCSWEEGIRMAGSLGDIAESLKE